MSVLPYESWYGPADTERVALALWEDSVEHGYTEEPWETSKGEFRRVAEVILERLWSGR